MAMQIPSSILTLHPEHGRGNFTLKGRSRAGDGTTFILQELKWMFDMGAVVQQGVPNVVFLTHTHSDHITFMPQILTDDQRHTDVYLPAKALPFVEKFLNSYQEMIDCGEEIEDTKNGAKNYTLHPLEFGDVFDLTMKGTKYKVTALKCHHRIDCLGFSIFQSVKKLKPEYQGLEGREIGNLRKQGIDCHDVEEIPFLCYLGDTTHAVFENHPEILDQHKFIVVECSFFCDKTRENAKKTRHMHWEDLKPIVESHPDILFILIHFSLRYSALDVRKFFATATTTHNVHPMIVEAEIRRNFARDRNVPVPHCDCFHCGHDRKQHISKQDENSTSTGPIENALPAKKMIQEDKKKHKWNRQRRNRTNGRENKSADSEKRGPNITRNHKAHQNT